MAMVHGFDVIERQVEQLQANEFAAAEALTGAEAATKEGLIKATGMIVEDLQNESGDITGRDIADFAEMAMRLDGTSSREASARAGRLARIFGSGNDEPLPVLFHSARTSGWRDRVIAVVNPANQTEDGGTAFQLRLGQRGGVSDHRLTATSTDPLGIFNRESLDLGNSSTETIYWTTHRTGTELAVDLRKIDIIEDPEEAAHVASIHGDYRKDRLFVGDEAVEAAILDRRRNWQDVYDPESVALAALVRISSGQEPQVEFRDGHFNGTKEGHYDRTLKHIAGYVGRLLGQEGHSRDELLAAGLPVLFHEAALEHQGIDADQIDEAILQGLQRAGGLTEMALATIYDRVATGKSDRKIGKTIDESLVARAEMLASTLEVVQFSEHGGVQPDAQRLLDAAITHPALYKSIMYPHRRSSMMSEITPQMNVAGRAISEYFVRAPRFRP